MERSCAWRIGSARSIFAGCVVVFVLSLLAVRMGVGTTATSRGTKPADEGRLKTMLDGIFQAEKTDSSWAPAVEDRVRRAVEGATRTYLQGSRVVACACRATLCKVRVENVGQAQHESLANLMFDAGLRIMAFRDSLAENSGETIFFVRRGTVFREPS